MVASKDLFSQHAQIYGRYRPRYPGELYAYLASLVPVRDLVWDCATGNGQAAIDLAAYFTQVIGTDLSREQLAAATPHPRIEYRVGSAEKAPLDDHCADLVTVAQAFHWLQQDAFFAEVRRILKPDGVVALWTYNLCQVSPPIDALVDHFYHDVVGPYWDRERRLVEEGYRNCKLPLREAGAPSFTMQCVWQFDELAGYLETWSAWQKYRKAQPEVAAATLADFRRQLQKAWGDEPRRLVTWPLAVRVGDLLPAS